MIKKPAGHQKIQVSEETPFDTTGNGFVADNAQDAIVESQVDVEDDDISVQVDTKIINFGDYLDVTNDGGGKVTVDVPAVSWADNDLDKFQFALQGVVSANKYLLTLNNIPSNNAPDVVLFNTIIRGISISNSNNAQPFTLRIETVDPTLTIFTTLWTRTFSIANGNWNGRSGIELIDPALNVTSGHGVAVKMLSVGNPKPANLNVILWTRKAL